MSSRRLDIAMYTEGLSFTGDTLERRALGGSETAFIEVARTLAALGHRVTAVCRCEREGSFNGVEYRDLAAAGAILAAGGDLLLCSRWYNVLAGRVPWRARFLWMHDLLLPASARGLGSMLPKIDRVYGVSAYHAAQIAQVMPAVQAQVAYNAVDHALIDTVRASAGAKRHRVMFTSRPERGLERALALYERLGDRELEFLACTYPSLPDPRVAAVEQRCTAQLARLAERGFPVRTASFSKRDLYRHMTESKVVVYPTDFPEVFCISAVEAQACGTAFLTNDGFALPETVGYERIPLGDDEAFLDRLRGWLTDDAARGAIEGRGLEYARRFTWRRTAERFIGDVETLQTVGRPTVSVALFDRTGGRTRFDAAAIAAGACAATDDDAVTMLARRADARARRWAAPTGFVPSPAGPTISCLTVTRGRLRLLKQAIRCYLDQTWAARELVIVTDAEPRQVGAIEHYLATLGRADVRLMVAEGNGLTLGRLRNLSLEAARGELVCQWDDDDLYHPERLATQADTLLAGGATACFLTDQLHYFCDEQRLFWIDWSGGGRVPGKWALVPGTVLRLRDDWRYPEHGPAARRGEDSALVDALAPETIARLSGVGHLYVYRYHGGNTFPLDHHRGQLDRAASTEFIHRRATALQRALDYYPLPRPISVLGRRGDVAHVTG